MIDLDVAWDKLAGMESADDIACFFRGYGLKALPKHGGMCAVAKWMQDITEVGDVQVTSEETLAKHKEITHGQIMKMGQVSYQEYRKCQYGWRREHTPAMKQFVMRFDRMFYPDLVDQELYEKIGGVYSAFKAEPMEIKPVPSDKANSMAYALSIGYKIYKSTEIKFTDITNC